MLSAQARIEKNLKLATKASQHEKLPFIFWDEHEVKKIDLSQLPKIKVIPEGWDNFGTLIEVNLNKPEEVEFFKRHALKFVIGNEDEIQEVGFAIYDRPKKVGDIISIQTFRKI